MVNEKKDAEIAVSYGGTGYSAISHKINVSWLDVVNNLCESASKQNKIVTKAKIKMKLPVSILIDNKSL